MKLPKLPTLVALAAGLLDFGTGLNLVFAPAFVLPLMGVNIPADEALVYLRFVGAFVGAVGASYLWALVRGGGDHLRAVLEFTIPFRLAAGAYSACAIGLGWLSPAWTSVPVTDFALVILQIWLLRKKLPVHE